MAAATACWAAGTELPLLLLPAVDGTLRAAHRAPLVPAPPLCPQGHGRSAAVAASLLLAGGQAGSAEEALRQVKAARPGASPNRRQVAALHAWAAAYGHAVCEG